jgi:uncharacterized protein YndB with AHSA1/START domain
MSQDLIISKSIDINTSPDKIWEVLINPEMIAQYFPGAKTITSWKIGSEIIFLHTYEGQEFKNKGIILDFNPMHSLSYTYWTAFSKTEDKPENYTTIIFTITESNGITNLALKQSNFKNVEWYQGLEIGWHTVLSKIKELSEK